MPEVDTTETRTCSSCECECELCASDGRCDSGRCTLCGCGTEPCDGCACACEGGRWDNGRCMCYHERCTLCGCGADPCDECSCACEDCDCENGECRECGCDHRPEDQDEDGYERAIHCDCENCVAGERYVADLAMGVRA